MATAPKVPLSLEEHALNNLRYIRDMVDRARPVTLVPGWGGVAMGLTALLATWIAAQQTTREAWLLTWEVEVVIAVLVGATALWWKARQSNERLGNANVRKFGLAFAPPIVAGALITAKLHTGGPVELLPGLWMCLYGAAVTAGGLHSVAIVPIMGACFVATGAVALFVPFTAAQWLMAAAFGGLHIGFGLAIARRHGG